MNPPTPPTPPTESTPPDTAPPTRWQALRALAGTGAPFALIALVLLGLAYLVLQPNPPRHVVLATGPDQGAYAEFGQRYARALAQHGITVELRETQGTVDNLRLLRESGSGVDIAFVQGGADPVLADSAGGANEEAAQAGPGLQSSMVQSSVLHSLGSLFFEPVWIFYREDAALRLVGRPTLETLAELRGARINVGAPGSGVPPLMERLLETHRIDVASLTLQRLPQTPAVMELLEGQLDAVVLASAPEAMMVQMLLQTPGVHLLPFAQAQALSRRLPFLSPVLLPRGVVDLARDIPASDVSLVAPTATLVARDSLHPALVQLFVQAARQIHSDAGWFQQRGDFPNAVDNERELAPEAARVYRSGVPWMQRYVPFWLSNLVDRMWVVMLSIVAVLIPLSRVVPPLVEFRIRSRVFRWYGQLREIESAQGRQSDTVLLQRLDDIDAHVDRISVPLSYADELFALRGHIQMVRRKLQAQGR